MGAGSNPANLLWGSNARDCVWVRYDDDFVVYHRHSAKTHLLNLAGHRLLTEILQEPISTSEVAARLASSSADDASPDEAAVRDMLLRFEHLGLVYRSVGTP